MAVRRSSIQRTIIHSLLGLGFIGCGSHQGIPGEHAGPLVILVGSFGAVLFIFKVKKSGAVVLVGATKQLNQSRIDIRAVGQSVELLIGFDPAMLAHS